jgi:hypothetical protein
MLERMERSDSLWGFLRFLWNFRQLRRDVEQISEAMKAPGVRE